MIVAVIATIYPADEYFTEYLPENTGEILVCATETVYGVIKKYAQSHKLRCSRISVIKGNANYSYVNIDQTVARADSVVVFWDGHSRFVEHIVLQCKRLKKNVRVHMVSDNR